MANIYEKISAIMEEVPYLKTDSKVEYGSGYMVITHAKVMETFRPLFVKHKIVVIPSVTRIEHEANMTTLWVEMRFINTEDVSDTFTIQAVGQGTDGGDKGMAKALSGAIKYIFLKIFCSPYGEDSDKENVPRRVFKPEQYKMFREAIRKCPDVDNYINQCAKAYGPDFATDSTFIEIIEQERADRMDDPEEHLESERRRKEKETKRNKKHPQEFTGNMANNGNGPSKNPQEFTENFPQHKEYPVESTRIDPGV